MKRNIKFYGVTEEGNIELIDSLELDIKANRSIRNIDNLKFNNDVKKIIKTRNRNIDNKNMKDILSEIVERNYDLFELGDVSYFKNIKYNKHIEGDIPYNIYENNILACFVIDTTINKQRYYINECTYRTKDILFNFNIYDCYKLNTIDCLLFIYEKYMKDYIPNNYREKCIKNERLTNALKEEYPNLTEGEYLLIKKRLCVLIDVFSLYDAEQKYDYKKEIEECVIFEEDDVIQRFMKLKGFHNLIKTR